MHILEKNWTLIFIPIVGFKLIARVRVSVYIYIYIYKANLISNLNIIFHMYLVKKQFGSYTQKVKGFRPKESNTMNL